jgi:hypothetical protein
MLELLCCKPAREFGKAILYCTCCHSAHYFLSASPACECLCSQMLYSHADVGSRLPSPLAYGCTLPMDVDNHQAGGCPNFHAGTSFFTASPCTRRCISSLMDAGCMPTTFKLPQVIVARALFTSMPKISRNLRFTALHCSHF